MHRTAVLDVVGLTPRLIGEHTPALSAFAERRATIGPVLPALTCSVQATYLTGKPPREHGIVANGWYFRDLDEVWLWRQSNRLIQAPKIWDLGRERDPSFTCANVFWWYAMATSADITLTPRPLYLQDGTKLPDCYSDPPELRSELNRELGVFPLFQFWGPATDIVSSDWIARAAMAVEEHHQPTLSLVYLPHLDYVLQREGPDGAGVSRDLAEVDELCGRLIDFYRGRDLRVVVLSEYGITAVSRPVHANRLLRDAGHLEVKVDLGREYLDTARSAAFAMADHQIAHVYVQDEARLDEIRQIFESAPGVAEVLDREALREIGLDHPRSGELVLLADGDSWFTYYFWHDDERAPDYARCVDIHRKPGYDPCELFVDPALRWPTLRIAATLAKKRLGLRTTMRLTPLDASLVRGSHGVAAGTAAEQAVFLTSEPSLAAGPTLDPLEVCDRILDHVFEEVP
ncbi:MAG: alkaline phosphatase family protein [Holophagales bacterium]|nr:alkaline phosphatase family protein [Holophagales bacterium]